MRQSVRFRPLAVLLCAAAVLEPRSARADDTAPAGSDLAVNPGAAPLAGTAIAKAPNVAEAEQYAAAAFDAYSRQEYSQAIELYEKALAAAPSADILYNIARVHDLGLHDRARAIDFYQRYLAHPSARAPRRDLVKRRVLELGASEQVVSRKPDPSVPIEAGLTEPSAVTTVTAPRTPHASGWTTRESVGAGLAGAGVLAVGVGIGFGVAAAAEHDAWSRDCSGNLCRTARGVDAAQTAARRATVATVALATGGGLLAVGATLWFLGSSRDENPNLALHVGTDPRSGDLGCALSGRF